MGGLTHVCVSCFDVLLFWRGKQAKDKKKELKENIGSSLKFIETSFFGDEYLSNGTMIGANRPHITGIGREFFAEVTMKDNLIYNVT